jgi:hypothetical protein
VELDSYLMKLKKKISNIDEEIIQAVRKQSASGSQSERDLVEAKVAIKTLFGKIQDIKQKAEQSESMVVEITRDIKALDYGKNNISNTIGAITKLQMMENVVDQLKNLSEKGQYNRVADLLKVVTDLDQFFTKYQDIPKIKDLHTQIENLKVTFQKSLLNDFKNIDENNNFRKDALANACQTVDSLGDAFRKEIIHVYVMKQIEKYKEKHPPLKGDLENVATRFGWLRKKLNDMKEQFGEAIPKAWNLPQEMAVEYFLATRELFLKMLKDIAASTLYKSLKDTIRFEVEITTRFAEISKNYNYNGLISKCYDDYMKVYLEDQDTLMNNTIESLISEEKWQLGSGHDSSSDLFIFIKSSFNYCVTVNKGRTLWQLVGIWKKYLMKYGQILYEKLPKPKESSTTFDISTYLSFVQNTPQIKFKLSPKEENTICYIIKISDYVQMNLEGLKSELLETLDQEFHEKTDFQKEREKMFQIFNTGIQLLVMNLMNTIQEEFDLMQKVAWGTFENMSGEESEYAQLMMKKIVTGVTSIKSLLGGNHFSTFCEKFVLSFFSCFMANIKKIKRLTSSGASQQLLDVTTFKNYLSKILDKDHDEEQIARFNKVLNAQASKPENILRMVLIPTDRLVETYNDTFKKRSNDELILIMEMKGITKQEQSTLMTKLKKDAVDILKN